MTALSALLVEGQGGPVRRRATTRARSSTRCRTPGALWRTRRCGERLKEAKGIGTPATRAEVIRGLKAQEFLAPQGKNIVPTERGLTLFEVLQKADPALVDPGVTAQLERLLDEVLIGKTEMMSAIDAVCAQASRIIGRLTERAESGAAPLVAASAPGTSGADRPPTPAMKAYVASLAQQKGIKPPRGYTSSGATCRAFLDKHASRKGGTAVGEAPVAQQATGRKRSSRLTAKAADPVVKNAAKAKRRVTTRAKTASAALSVATPSAAAGEIRLNIPYGNKEDALKLGARYRDGAWYVLAGIDLSGFRDKGWL